MPDHDEHGGGHVVRPRWTWGGLVLSLAGLATVGAGMGVGLGTSWLVIVVGLAVTAAGAAAAIYGNLFYDIHSSAPPGAEASDLATGEAHVGPDPDSRVERPEAQREAQAAAEQLQRIQDATAAAKPRARWGRRRR